MSTIRMTRTDKHGVPTACQTFKIEEYRRIRGRTCVGTPFTIGADQLPPQAFREIHRNTDERPIFMGYDLDLLFDFVNAWVQDHWLQLHYGKIPEAYGLEAL